MQNSFQRSAARVVLTILSVALLYGPSLATATPILLGSAQGFAVLAGSTVTNTGNTTITGDLGVWPGTAYTGGGTVILTGTEHLGDGVAMTAQGNVTYAYNTLAGLPVDTVLTGTDLGGTTLPPGVYFFASSAPLTGTLFLDAGSDPNALFVFQIGSTLITASGSAVNVINGGSNNGVYWQVGSSATLGLGTTFAGNILADQSITLNTGATLNGRALARIGAVTLDANTISNDDSVVDFGSAGFSGGGLDAVIPEPGSVMLLGMGLLLLILFGRRSRKRLA